MGFKREGLRGSKGGVEVVLPQQQAMNDPYSKENCSTNKEEKRRRR